MPLHDDEALNAGQATHATLGTEDQQPITHAAHTPNSPPVYEKNGIGNESASRTDSIDEKDEKYDAEKHAVPEIELAALDDMARIDNDKVLETAADFATALVSADDDPTLRINTFRMWFCGIGFAGFGSVLGMLFVSLCYRMVRLHRS